MKFLQLEIELLKKNMSRADLAKELKISRSTLSRKLNGVSDFSRKEIECIVQVFDLTADETSDIFFNNALRKQNDN